MEKKLFRFLLLIVLPFSLLLASSCSPTGVYNGYGTKTYSNGKKYVGEWKNGKYNGQGTITDPNGAKYVGIFEKGKPNGQGTITFPDGRKYTGGFVNGGRNGHGTMIFLDGGKYFGEWENDKYNGQGTETFPDGSKYVGEFENGIRSGHGTKTYSDGGKYVGKWENGQFNGQGTYTFLDGGKYFGEWENDKYNGQGTFTFPDGGKYVGEWENDKYNGQGTETFPDGSKYVGEFENGKHSGQGTYTGSKGLVYTGEWNDKGTYGEGFFLAPNGTKIIIKKWWGAKQNYALGVIQYSNGNSYYGEISEPEDASLQKMEAHPDDHFMYQGSGILVLRNGKKQEGVWKDNKLISLRKISDPNIISLLATNLPKAITHLDTSVPKIILIEPRLKRGIEITSKESRILVKGRVTDESDINEIVVNGINIENIEKGYFAVRVPLKTGENRIYIRATDFANNLAEKTFTITREHEQAPFLKDDKGFSTGNYFALIIGNNDYNFLPKLQTATNDAREISKLLEKVYGFKTKLLLNATRKETLREFNNFRKKLTLNDNLLVYYAGHGEFDKIANKAFWLPVDAERDDDSSWIIVDSITSNIRRISSNHILIVADSCYSGTLTRNAVTDVSSNEKRDRYLKKMIRRSSRTLLASGGNEPVSDNGGEGHSIFAQAFIDGLKEMDMTTFTAEELFYNYVKEVVAGSAEQIPEYNTIRNSGHKGGDFIFKKIKGHRK